MPKEFTRKPVTFTLRSRERLTAVTQRNIYGRENSGRMWLGNGTAATLVGRHRHAGCLASICNIKGFTQGDSAWL